MKCCLSKLVLILSLLISFTLSTEVKVKSFLSSHKDILVPESMKKLINDSEDIRFPNPKKQALEFLNFFYDMDFYNCDVGISIAQSVKNINMNFLEGLRPINESTSDEVNLNIKLLESSLKEMIDALTMLEKSNCIMFIKQKAIKFKKTIFLMTIK